MCKIHNHQFNTDVYINLYTHTQIYIHQKKKKKKKINQKETADPEGRRFDPQGPARVAVLQQQIPDASRLVAESVGVEEAWAPRASSHSHVE